MVIHEMADVAIAFTQQVSLSREDVLHEQEPAGISDIRELLRHVIHA